MDWIEKKNRDKTYLIGKLQTEPNIHLKICFCEGRGKSEGGDKMYL